MNRTPGTLRGRARRGLVPAALLAAALSACDGHDLAPRPLPLGAPSAAASEVSLLPDFGVAADGADAATLEVRVRDAAGRPLPGVPLAYELAGAGSAAVASPLTTGADGVATAPITSLRAGPVTVTVTLEPGPGGQTLPPPPPVEFVWPLPDTFFVRRTGEDTPDGSGGRSPATAWRTLAQAAAWTGPGDTVFVGAGTYAESVLLTAAGSADLPLRFVADPAGMHTGDAGEVIIDALLAPFALRLEGRFITIEGFTLRGAFSDQPGTGGVVVTGSDNTVRSCTVYENPYGVYIAGGARTTVEGCAISNNAHLAGDGIVVDGAAGCTLRNNLVYNNAGCGIRVTGGSADLLAENDTLFRNGLDQFFEDGAASNAILRHNILANGGGAGLRLSFGSALTADHNLVFGHPAGDYDGTVPGPGDVSGPPLFADPLGGDLLLGGPHGGDDRFQVDGSASPAADAGAGVAIDYPLSGGTSFADCSTRQDGVLDGSGADGAVLNLGYHYPANPGALAPLGAGEGRLFYAANGDRRLRTRQWREDLSGWTPAAATPPVGAKTRWVAAVIPPAPEDDAFLAAYAEEGATARLKLSRWTGQGWSQEWRADGLDPAHADKRGFDLACEGSGDLLAVWSDGGPTPLFRTRSRGVWTEPAPLPLNGGADPIVNTGTVLWVELVAAPAGDRIALLYADSDGILATIQWDGAAWETATAAQLEGGLLTNPGSGLVHNRVFDAAFEHSGRLLAAWGRSSGTGFWWALYDPEAGAWSAPAQEASAPNNGAPHFVDLCAEPLGDRIAGVFVKMNGTERLGLALWDGSAWTAAGTYDGQVSNWNNMGAGDVPAAVGWVGTAGIAVCLYADSGTRRIDWLRWTASAGWSMQADVAVPGKNRTESVLLTSWRDRNRLLAVFSDSRSRLYAASYDGSAWTLLHSGAALENTLSSSKSMPFGFAFQAP